MTVGQVALVTSDVKRFMQLTNFDIHGTLRFDGGTGNSFFFSLYREGSIGIVYVCLSYSFLFLK